MSPLDEAIICLLDIEDHRADCPKCRPASEVFLQSQMTSADQLRMSAEICPEGRELWDRYGELGKRVLAERSA